MLIREWEYNKFIDNILNYKLVLVHGQDRGKVDEKSHEIVKQLKFLNKDSLEIINFEPEEFYKSKSYFYDLVYQNSFFSKLTIIRINLDLLKSEQDFLPLLENLDVGKTNYIILESKYLLKKSPIMRLFSKVNNYALLTCYQESNVKQTVLKYAKLYSLNLDNHSLSYLSQKLGNDTLITKNEIKKLSLYSNGEKVNFSDILDAVGDNSLITLNEFTDSIGIEKKIKIYHLYEKTINLGLNYIIFLRSISRHLRILLESKSNKIIDAKEIKPLIHFSRFEKINQQLQSLTIDQIKKYMLKTYELEIECKNNYVIHELLIKKFVLKLANY